MGEVINTGMVNILVADGGEVQAWHQEPLLLEDEVAVYAIVGVARYDSGLEDTMNETAASWSLRSPLVLRHKRMTANLITTQA